MDWTVEQARSKNPVISGFHSPLEQSALKVLHRYRWGTMRYRDHPQA